MRVLVPLLVVAIAAVLLVPLLPSARGDVMFATLAGPTALAPGQVGSYTVTVSGSPSNATLDYQWYIEGANTTGGSPLAGTPGTQSGNATSNTFNVTAPSAVGTISVYVSVRATPEGGGTTTNTSVTQSVTVIQPIVLSATFHNDGPSAATNVTVRFYVDDTYAGQSVLKSVAANADATATFNYLPVGLAPGSHTVRVEASLAPAQSVTYTVFYKDVATPSTGLVVILGIVAFIPVFILTVGLRRRQK